MNSASRAMRMIFCWSSLLLCFYHCGSTVSNNSSVGPAGGSVVVEGSSARIDVPGGALTEQQILTMTEVPFSGSLPDNALVVGRTWRLGPEGLVFRSPITLSLPVSSPANRVYTRPVGEQTWTLASAGQYSPTENIIRVQVTHFSEFVPAMAPAPCERDSDCNNNDRCVAGVCIASTPLDASGTDAANDVLDGGTPVRADAADGAVDASRTDVANETIAVPVERGPLRPLRPCAACRVSSLRPSLRWIGEQGAEGAQVEVCADRACSMVLQTLRSTTRTVLPTADLPRNKTLFWRVRAVQSGAPSMQTSAVWSFRTPGRSAAMDVSLPSLVSFDGSGVSHLALLEGDRYLSGAGRPTITIYRGTTVVQSFQPPTIPTHSSSGYEIASGDLNGDGYTDLAVLAQDRGLPLDMPTQFAESRLLVYLGRSTGLSNTPNWNTAAGQAIRMIAGDDFDGDGNDDLLLYARDHSGQLFAGSAMGMTARTLSVSGEPTQLFELNGDGLLDFVFDEGLAGVRCVGNPHGRSFVQRINSPGMLQVPSSNFVGAAGDLNGDGFPELSLGGWNERGGTSFLFSGTETGPSTTVARVSHVPADGHAMFGTAVVSLGDQNQDGYGDVAIGSVSGDRTNSAFIYTGSSSLFSLVEWASADGPGGSQTHPFPVFGGRDLDGDGIPDLVMSAGSARAGSLFLVFSPGRSAGAHMPGQTLITYSCSAAMCISVHVFLQLA